MITELTPEQEALIPVVRDKWRKIALDSSSTDKTKAEVAINNLYQSANFKTPEIIWFDNPVDACLWLGEKSDSDLINLVPIEWSVICDGYGFVKNNLHIYLKQKLGYYTHFSETIYDVLVSTSKECLLDREWFYFQHILGRYSLDIYDDVICANYYDMVDIGYRGEKKNWEKIAKKLGFGLWWAFIDIAVVTIKPSITRFDNNLRLHADGKIAFQYEQPSIITEEKLEIYAYHGSIIPEKYGFIKYENWQPQWLAKEKDSKLKWILAK